VHGCSGELRAQGDDLCALATPGKIDLGLVEVGLGLRPDGVALGHEHLGPDAELAPALAHVAANRGLAHRHMKLLFDPLPDPAGGVTLLSRSLLVRAEDPVDEGFGLRCQARGFTARLSTVRRDRRGDSLAHRAPVHSVLSCDLTFGHPHVVVLPDKLKQLHPAHSFLPLTRAIRQPES